MVWYDMKKIFVAILFLSIGATSALAQTGSSKTPTALASEINIFFPDNTVGLITPYNARQTLQDIVSSYLSNNPASPIPSLSIAAGTLPDLGTAFSLTATMPASPSANEHAVQWTCTGNGNASFLYGCFGLTFNAGYTGNKRTISLDIDNYNAGTGAVLVPTTSPELNNSNAGHCRRSTGQH
jgi:hypothetical protein